ncbi:cell division protein FtsX [Azospirillum rugosum]|uniref:Cell division transport system permease protein n=1 Tax=Azospirillum rugosum TaxID=416170 RepID=A0ABS4SJ29_9PROT|nr:FtsX-like permease family protein [Azospirillum rugosum]MBP2292575.1 cell division transport system permease protein [Azospirillum rugosum]MDQ0526401.1 cell division transport system permease protein [Azospirillum rugosum]
MALPPLRRKRFDLPLAKDPTSRFLTWLTALMVYLAALSLAGALFVSDMARRWDTGLAGGLTVQIVPLPAGSATLNERTEAALTVLRSTPGVKSATALTTDDIGRLLEPWLGKEAADPLLPMPRLIDVVTDGPVDTTALTARLKSAAPGATMDDHAVWLADLRRFAGALHLAALAVMALIGGAGVMAVVFAVRAGLAIHKHVVELLHLMGATDRYVARQFESHVLSLTLRGGLGGLVLAVATLAGIGHAAAGLKASLLPTVTINVWHLALLAVVPVVACLLAMVTARWTVLRTLESLP